MTLLQRLLLPVATALVLLAGCGDDGPSSGSDTPRLQINGRVLKSDGKPLDSAEVVLLFHTDPPFAANKSGASTQAGEPIFVPNPATESALLNFEVLQPNTFVTARILDPVIGAIAAAPLNRVVPDVGAHTVLWNLKEHEDSLHSIRNGRYTANLQIGDDVRTSDVLINSRNSTFFAISDSVGRFFIDYRLIPIGFIADRINSSGTVSGQFIVTDTVTVLVRRRGYQSKEQVLPIDRSKPVSITLTL